MKTLTAGQIEEVLKHLPADATASASIISARKKLERNLELARNHQRDRNNKRRRRTEEPAHAH